MCTVTFLTVNNRFHITSNRDEKMLRKNAVHPAAYKHDNILLTYPKDADAGGTWIAMKDNGDAAVLLNGAFKSHGAKPPYRKSRGLIFLDIFSSDSSLKTFNFIPLHNIEPFTIIIFENKNLFECRWDGNKKYQQQLDINKPYIWSSATLYSAEVIQRREEWFNKWLLENPSPSQEDILAFHQFGGEGDAHNDFLMNRNNIMLTVSVTGIELNANSASMHYLDLKQKTKSKIQTHFKKATAAI